MHKSRKQSLIVGSIAIAVCMAYMIACLIWPVAMAGVIGQWAVVGLILVGVVVLVLAVWFLVTRAMEASE